MASIRQLKSGSWNVQVRKAGKTKSKTFMRKTDAQKWARNIEVEIEQGQFINTKKSEKLTLGDVCNRFEDEVIHQFKSWKSDRSRLRNIKENKISKILLINLNSSNLAEFRDSRLAEGMSKPTINHELTLISRVLKKSMSDWDIYLPRGIPFVKKFKKEEGRSRRITNEEIEAILSESESKELENIALIALETSMRRSEIVGIEWKNINLVKRYIKIYDTKNGTDRLVPLSSKAVQIIKSIKQVNERLFHLKPDSVTQAFERATKRAKKKLNKNKSDYLQDIRFHDLRHESTSRIAKKVSNIIELSAVTGHKDVQMLKRYYHTDIEDLAKKLT